MPPPLSRVPNSTRQIIRRPPFNDQPPEVLTYVTSHSHSSQNQGRHYEAVNQTIYNNCAIAIEAHPSLDFFPKLATASVARSGEDGIWHRGRNPSGGDPRPTTYHNAPPPRPCLEQHDIRFPLSRPHPDRERPKPGGRRPPLACARYHRRLTADANPRDRKHRLRLPHSKPQRTISARAGLA